MTCKDYADALMEFALSGEADAGLRAHLAECAACRAEQERLARLASAMDRGLATMMNVEPSPGFAARLRLRVADESERRVAWWGGWVPALAGGLAVAVLAAWLVRSGISTREPGNNSNSPTIASVPTPTNPPVSASPNPASATPAHTTAQLPVRRPADTSKSVQPPAGGGRGKPVDLPEVLVAGDEWKQVVKLYALAQRGGVNSQQLAPPELTPLEGTVVALAIAKLEGQPIAIRPLAENPPSEQRQ